jgi:peptidoglycan/xylan/chitin deacetylase (PgdA/CDA1 family)
MKLGLKIDVDTFRGTKEGVPRLVRLLERHAAGASFFFSLGPDHTGRALRRMLLPGFFGKVRRTSVVSHYGVRTLLYGTLLPGPDISRQCTAQMRAVQEAGFEAGIHCWDHVRWQDFVARRAAAWTEREMLLAEAAYERVFGDRARSWAAAGWQTNAHAAAHQEEAGFDYASDTRGVSPFLPAWGGRQVGCIQIPTTLPTLDELMGRPGIDPVRQLLELTENARTHVFTAHAELEGGRLAPAFETLLAAWKAQGYRIASLAALRATIERKELPVHEVVRGAVAGRSGVLALQGALLDGRPLTRP